MTRLVKTTLKIRNGLMRQYGLSITGIKKALAYKSMSARAERIRQTAISQGGEIVESAFCPDCYTQHTQDEIIQTFSNGVVLVINKHDSSAVISRKDVIIGTYANVTMNMWDDLIRRASKLAEVK